MRLLLLYLGMGLKSIVQATGKGNGCGVEKNKKNVKPERISSNSKNIGNRSSSQKLQLQ